MMKYKYLILFVFGLLIHACDDITDKDSPEDNEGSNTETGTAGIYVLSEGLFNLNNSTLMFHSLKNGQTDTDYFRSKNHRGLGDTANDMAIYGSKLYIVVNVSSQIEVIDRASGLSLKRIPVLNENGSSRQPRYIAFHKDKAYVCSFDGTVARIDTTSLEIEEYATVGRNPDGICVQGDKLYVSNSGGLDWDGIGVDNTVSVVSTEPFKEIKKIQVGYNPGRIRADNYGHVYVATRGKDISAGDYNFVQIDTRTDEVKQIYDEKVMNFAINDQLAYLYNFNYTTQDSQIKVFNLQTGTTLREDFITDETEINTPYGIYVNPYSGNIYITDAYNYLVRGDVLCFNPQGKLIYRLTNIGQNPNTVVFSDKDTQSGNDDPDTPQAAAFANKVLEYRPAPTQFMNTTATAYKEGFTYQQVLEYATELLSDRNVCLLSLGAFGGYITVGFDHTVPNISGEYDFKIYGNAAYDIYGTNEDKPGGSAEPGIVLVSKDTNGNGLPDDEWYELAGSEYNSPSTIRNYEITYYRPELPGDNVQWTDNQGGQGEIKRNDFNTQDSYYPQWIEEDRITFSGSRLADNAVNEPRPDMPEHWVGYCYAWGYADNHPNDTEYSKFKIDWAVDKNGNPVHLDGIDFVKKLKRRNIGGSKRSSEKLFGRRMSDLPQGPQDAAYVLSRAKKRVISSSHSSCRTLPRTTVFGWNGEGDSRPAPRLGSDAP